MSKRRKRSVEPELPLFDLPLHDDVDPAEGVESHQAPTPAKKPRRRKKKAVPEAPVESPMLFSEEELHAAQPDISGPQSAERETREDEEPGRVDDETPLIQDRLLGGLADLTIHLAVLGSMIVAVQLMGIPVALDDWPAFATLAVVFSGLYSVVPLAFWGRTPGMAWVGHCARSESDEPLSFGQTVMRWTGALFTVLLVGLPLLLGLGGRSLADRLSDSKTLQL